jgi:hypothetical protein
MLRISADCDQVPPDVIDIVKAITSTARRAVRAVRVMQHLPSVINRIFSLAW